MLKNKWFIGVLVLGLAATVAYNLTYFASRGQRPVPSQNEPPAVSMAAPQVLSNSIGASQPLAGGPDEMNVRPVVSLEEITQQAQSPLLIKTKQEALPKKFYPARDPFQSVPVIRPAVRELKPDLTSLGSEREVAPPDPVTRVTAILVQGERRLAVVNGYPKGVGSHIGDWQIAAIEPGYVMMRTMNGERKIEIETQVTDVKSECKP